MSPAWLAGWRAAARLIAQGSDVESMLRMYAAIKRVCPGSEAHGFLAGLDAARG